MQATASSPASLLISAGIFLLSAALAALALAAIPAVLVRTLPKTGNLRLVSHCFTGKSDYKSRYASTLVVDGYPY